jgi:hypothetical protein
MDEPLAVKLLALFSHFNDQVASVRDVVDRDLHNLLQRRLSNQATHELQLLDILLLEVARPTVQPFPRWRWKAAHKVHLQSIYTRRSVVSCIQVLCLATHT